MKEIPIDAIARYCDRELQEKFALNLLAHSKDAMGETGLDAIELGERLGEAANMLLFAAALEDFMTRPDAPGGVKVTDAFLKRNGWKLTPSVRRALHAVRDSVMSLYEVTAIRPGVGVELRDLLLDQPPIELSNPGLAEAISPNDGLAGRVLRLDGKAVLSSSFLPIVASKTLQVAQAVRAAAGRGDDPLTAEQVAPLAPHISNAWLMLVLQDVADEPDQSEEQDQY